MLYHAVHIQDHEAKSTTKHEDTYYTHMREIRTGSMTIKYRIAPSYYKKRKLERKRSHAPASGESTHRHSMPFGMKGPEKIL